MMFPNFLSHPALIVRIPVLRAMLRYAFVMPSALSQEKDNPGMPVFVLLLLAISIY